MTKLNGQKGFSPAKIFAAMAAACVFGQAHAEVPAENALPTGGQVTAGQAHISQHENTMNIDQSSQRAVVNWSSFDVGSKATVNFNQPNAQAATLNIVNGASKSMINGAVNANGQVIFVNNNGVVFGKHAEVNVGGMVATTMNVDQQKFMNGDEKLTFTGDGNGKVVNKGHLNVTSLNGYIALMAPEVKNEGVITATLSGENAIALISGKQVSLTFSGSQLVSVSVDASSIKSLIQNKRLIQTNGGQVIIAANSANDLLGSVIKNTGVISATGIAKKGGVISLIGDTVKQAGNVVANSDTHEGGKVTISGNNVTLASGSNTTATGATQGGQILVGTTVAKPVLASNSSGTSTTPIAKNVTVEAGANVDASATQKGNGGTIAIWSQIKTIVAGNLTAKAGAQGGNGGNIETSSVGKVAVTQTAKIDTSATKGKAGNWTIDPVELVVDQAAATAISNALNNSNVTLDATLGGCAGFGVCTNSATAKITFNADARITSTNVQTALNLIATGGEINFNSVIESGSINAVADTINVNATATLTAIGGNTGNILLAGANLNILGVINANGSTGNSGSTSSANAGTASAAARRRTGVDSGLAADLNTYLSNGGNVQLSATGDILISTNASITANGLNGGSINIVSQNGTVNVEGVVDAVGTQNAGGNVIIAGQTATVMTGALVSVAGLSFGGQLQIGVAQNIGSGTTTAPPAVLGSVAHYLPSALNVLSQTTWLDSNTGISASATIQNNHNQAGQIYVAGNTALTSAATIHANGDNGGLVLMVSPLGNNQNTGYIQTNGGAGLGGTVVVSGLNSTTLVGANFEANGTNGGGYILIGRDFKNNTLPGSAYLSSNIANISAVLSVPTSITTQIDSATILSANAITQGNGGAILAWGDVLYAHGHFNARGGLLSGNGGLVETSGANDVDVTGFQVSTSAPNGQAGTWLLDPADTQPSALTQVAFQTVLTAGNNVVYVSSAAISAPAMSLSSPGGMLNVTFDTRGASKKNITLGAITDTSSVAGAGIHLNVYSAGSAITASAISVKGALTIDNTYQVGGTVSGYITRSNAASLAVGNHGVTLNGNVTAGTVTVNAANIGVSGWSYYAVNVPTATTITSQSGAMRFEGINGAAYSASVSIYASLNSAAGITVLANGMAGGPNNHLAILGTSITANGDMLFQASQIAPTSTYGINISSSITQNASGGNISFIANHAINQTGAISMVANTSGTASLVKYDTTSGTKASKITAGALTLTAGSTSAINYIMKSAGSALDPAAIGTSTIRLPGYVLLDNTFGCSGAGCTPATGYYTVNNIATVVPTTSIGVTINNAFYTTGNITVKGIASANHGINYSALMNTSAGDISLSGATTNSNAVIGSVGLTANNITILGLASAASGWISQVNAMTINTAAIGGSISVTATNATAGNANGLYQTGAISGASGTNITFTSNNIINTSGAITLAANTSGTASTILYDTSTGTKLSTIATGALSVTGTSTSAINYWIKASGAYINPNTINVPGYITIDNTYLNGVSGGITSANLATYATTGYGIQINNALTAATNITIKAVSSGGNNAILGQAAMVATNGDIELVGTGTSSYVVSNAIEGVAWHVSPLTANNGAIRITGTATTGSAVLWAYLTHGLLTAKSITVNGTTNLGAFATYLGAMTIVAGGGDIYVTGTNVTNGAAANSGIYQASAITVNGSGSNISFISNGVINQTGAIALVANTSANASTILYDTTSGTKASNITANNLTLAAGSTNLVSYVMKSAGSALNPGALNVTGSVLLDNTFGGTAGAGGTPTTGFVTASNLATMATTSPGVKMDNAVTADRGITIKGISNGGYGISFTAVITSTTQAISLTGTSTTSSGVYASSTGAIVALSDQVTIVGRSTTGQAVQLASPLTGNAISITANGTTAATITSLVAMTVNTVYTAGTNAAPTFISLSSSATNGTYIGTIAGTSLPTLTAASLAGTTIGTGAAAIQSASVIYAMAGNTATNANYLIGWGTAGATKMAQLNLQLIGTQVIATTMAAKTSTTTLTTGSGTNIQTLWTAGTAATAQATSLATAGIGISNIAFAGTTFTNNSSGNLSVEAYNTAAGSAAGISQTGVINVNANGGNITFKSNNRITQSGQINLVANTSGATSNVLYDTTLGNKTSNIVAGILVNTGSTSAVNYLMKASGAAIDPAVTVSGSVVLDNTYGCTGTGCTPVSGYITLANAATLATTGVGVTTTGTIAAGTYVTLKGISSGAAGVVLGGVVIANNGDVTIDGYSTAAGARAVDMPTAFGAYAYYGNILVRGTKSVASTLTTIYMQGSSASAPLVLSASGNIDVIGYAPSSSTSIIYSTSAVFVAGGNITLSASTGGTTEATVSLNSSAIKASGTLTIQGASLANNVATAAPGAAVSAVGKGIYLSTTALTVPAGRYFEGSYTGIVANGDIWMAATTTGAYDAIYSSAAITSNNGSVTLIGVAGGNGGKGVNLAANVVAGASNGVVYSAGTLAAPTMIYSATPIGQISGSTLPTLTGAVIAGLYITPGSMAATVIVQTASTANSATYLVGVNDMPAKMVQVVLTKSGNNVYASATAARYAVGASVTAMNIESLWNVGITQAVAPTKNSVGYGLGNLTFDNSVAITGLGLSSGSNINISGSATNATSGYGVYVTGGGATTSPVVFDAVGQLNINTYVAGGTGNIYSVLYSTNHTLFKSGGDFTISANAPNLTTTTNWSIYLVNTVMSVGGNFTLQGSTLSTLTNANGSSAGATIANVATAAANTAANFGVSYGIYLPSSVTVTYNAVNYSNINVTGNISITAKAGGASTQTFYNNTPMTAGGTLTIDATATGNNASAVYLNSGTLTSTGLMSITGRTSTGTGITGVYSAVTLNSAGGVAITGLGATGGTTGHISITGAITNTGTTGTGITISSTYNTSLGNVTNSGANGIRITGGAGIAAGTATGGTITALGTMTNTGGIVAISMAQPVSPSATTPEGKIGITTANASMANIRYSVQGGNFTTPTLYTSGNYIDYRSNIASYTASATVANYSQPYGTAYNESTALDWLRTGSNVTLTVPTLPFGISLASIKAGLVWNSTIGAAAVNANIVQNATALNAGSIRTADGVNVTISSGSPTYTITKANLTITNGVSTTTYDGVTTYANLVSAAGYTVTGLVTSIGGVNTGDAVSAVTQTIKSGATVGSGTAVSGVAQAGSFNAVPSAATGTGLANYNITYVGKASTVAKAPLQLTALADSKVYGEITTTLGLTYLPNDGWAESTDGRGYRISSGRLLGSDTLTKVYLNSSGYEATAGVANNWTLQPFWVDSAAKDNYNITFVASNLAVTPRPLTITASSQSTTYGTALNLGTAAFTTSGLVNGDAITAVTLKYNTATTVPGTLNAGAYTGVITPSAAVGTGNAVNQSGTTQTGNLTSISLEANNTLVTYNNYTITYVPGNLTVNQKALTLSLNTQTKVYDATAFAALNSGSYNLTGFANGESATINQTVGTYNSANVANATTVSAALTSSNYVAGGSTLLSNYILPTTASGTGTITRATLTITADSAAKFMGQTDPSFTYTYSGLQGTDTLAAAAGTVTVVPNRTTSVSIQSSTGVTTGVMPASGSEVAGRTYLAALMPSASAMSGNYQLTAVGGDYSIAGAGQLIVKVGNTTVSYGTYSNTTNLAVAIASSVTALYCNLGSACGAGDIQTLTKTSTSPAGSNVATFVAEDALSPKGIIQFNVALNSATPASYSTGGYLNVGAYAMTPSSATPVSAQINYENNNPTYPIIYTSGQITVTPITLTVSNGSTPTKQYDTTTSMSGLVITPTNALSGDALSLSGFGTYDAASAGSNLGYTIANIQALGADAANYALASSTISGTNGVITKAPVTISGLAANDKVYDTNNSVTLIGTPTVFGALEAVTISSGSASATFNSTNVANNIGVTANLSGLVLSNTNYEITGVTSALTADITPARITVTAAKAYDGSLTVAQGGLTVTGVAGQTLSFASGVSATLTNPNVNSAAFASLNNAVLANGSGGSAGLASNYTLVNPILSTVTITPANITISASNAVKTYDQSTSIVGATTVPSAILVSGTLYTNAATSLVDTLSGGSFVYTNANAGSGNKTLQVSAVGVMNGTLGANANYNITYQNNTTSTINPLGITVSGLSAANKGYDGGATAVISGTPTANGVLSGDTLTFSGSVTSGTFADPNAANNITVTPVLSGLSLSNANYVIIGTTSPLSANITPKEITFTGSATKVYDGSTSLTGVTVSTGVGSETLTLTNATANSADVGSGNFISAATLGNCAGVGCTGLASNYILPVTLDANTAPANITSVALLVTADNQSMTYGDGSLPTFTATITGFVNGENTSVISGAASLTTAATSYNGSTAGSASTAGTYAITAAAGTLSATNYSFSYVAGTLTVNKADLTITASDDSKVYGSTTTAAGVTYVNGVATGATAGFTHTGLVNGDTLSSVTLTSTGGNATANVADGPFVITASAAAGSARTTTSNYNITYAPASTGLSVTPLTLTLNSTTQTRVYNGTDALANITVSTGVGSETVTLTNVSAYSANVGSGNYIDAATISSGTGTASNYALPTLNASNAPVSITTAPLSIAGVKTYDATTGLSSNQVTLSGLIGQETLTFTGAAANDADVADASYISAMTLADGTNGGLAANYALPSLSAASARNTATITPLTLDLTGLTVTRAYNGTDALANITVSTGVGSETVTLTNVSAYSANVGSGNYIDAATITSGTGTASNYALPTLDVSASTVSITTKDLSIAGVKTYDATTDFTSAQVTLTGLVGSETLIVSGVTSNDANVATANKYLTAITLADDTGLASNYALPSLSAYSVRNTATITTAPLSIAGTKPYDATTGLSSSQVTLTGLVGSETLAISSVAANDANVASASYISAITLANGTNGGLATNYALPSLSAASARNTATINPLTLTLNNVATTSVYNGTDALANITVSTGIGSQTIILTNVSAYGANVGSGNYIDAATITSGTGTASNYALPTLDVSASTVSITTKDLSIAGVKTYDATTDFTSAQVTLTGLVGSETLTVSGVTSNDANVATANKYLTAITLADGTGLASNYALPSLSAASARNTATITPMTLSLTGSNAAASRAYNGTDALANITVSTGIGSQTITLTNVSAYSANVGSGNYIDAATITSGTGTASNYALPTLNASNAPVSITPKPVTLTAPSINKVYDGGYTYTLTSADLAQMNTQLVGADTVNAATAIFVGNNPNVGANKAVTLSSVTINDGNNGTNYSVTYANSTGAVTRASLLVTAANDAKFVSRLDNTGGNYAGALYDGFVNGETAANLGGALLITRTNASVNTVGDYVGVLQPSGLTSSNYQITYANGNYTIVAAENLLIRATAVTTYGTAPTYSFTAQYLAADNTTISYIGFTGTSPSASAINLSAVANRSGVASFTLDDGGTQATLAIGPSGATLSGSSNVNVGQYNAISAATPSYSNATPSFRGVTVVGQLQVNPLVIAAPTLAPNSISKVYDGNAVISGIDTAAASSQLLAGDAVAISANGIYSDKNVADNKSVTVNFALSGAEAGNYVMANTQITGNYGRITQLASVTYVGPSGGNWSTANNWAGGAIPDYSNVANVIIPTNTTVHFDSAVGGPMTSAIQNDGLLDINLNASTTFANTITGTGVLQISNVGTITLTGNNSYSGGTVLSAGSSLIAGSNNAIGTGAVTSNGTALNPASFATANNVVLPSLTITGGTTKLMSSITTTGAQSYADLILGTNVTLTTSNANISLLGKVDSAVNKTNDLVMNAGTGNVTIADSIGSVARFNNLTVTGRFIYILADILTGMTQTYNGSALIGDVGLLGRTPVVGFLFSTRASYFQYQSGGRTSSIEYLNTNPIYIRTLITEDPEVTFNGTVNDVTANTHTLLIAAVAPTQPANNATALNGAASINFNQAVGAEAPLYSVNLQTILSSTQANSSDVYLGMISMIDSIATYRSQYYRANMMQGQSSGQAAGTVTFSVWDPTATVTYLLPLQTTANSNCTSTCGQMNLQNTGGRQDAIVINGSNNFMSVRNSTGINNWGTRVTQNNALGYVPSPVRNNPGLIYDMLRISRRVADMHRNENNWATEKRAVVSVGEAQVEGGSQDCQNRRRDDKDIGDTECRLENSI